MASSTEIEIGVWTAAFSLSHIGMSAIREDLIDKCGTSADKLGLINRQGWRLPDIWPGDEAGQSIFPTNEIAGRQIYRIGYTIVSFVTLGSAFVAYLHALKADPKNLGSFTANQTQLYVATVSWAISFASLFNPSPLSLVPSYEQTSDDEETTINVRRDDSRKLEPLGLTRITRHPLILPVVSWGLATAQTMGGSVKDYLFFGGLSTYAIAGCLAQDLRVSGQEGSVGTVFTPGESLQDFFQSTSFVPFGAVFKGRQALSDIIREVPWIAVAVGLIVGYEVQTAFINWLIKQATAL